MGKFAIHTTRKRMIGVQRELKAAGLDFRAFEILNLGKYERAVYAGYTPATVISTDPSVISTSLAPNKREGAVEEKSSSQSGKISRREAARNDMDGGARNGKETERQEMQRRILEQKEKDFITLILRAYRAEAVENLRTFHGKKIRAHDGGWSR